MSYNTLEVEIQWARYRLYESGISGTPHPLQFVAGWLSGPGGYLDAANRLEEAAKRINRDEARTRFLQSDGVEWMLNLL